MCIAIGSRPPGVATGEGIGRIPCTAGRATGSFRAECCGPFQACSATFMASSAPRWSLILRRLSMSFCDPAKFMQSEHLHLPPHMTPAWKHSQYFFKHSERLHLHPMLCPLCVPKAMAPCKPLTEILGLKAFGFLARVSFMALSRMLANASMFWQSVQLQPSQKSSAAKHSQYSFRHLDFLQLQGLLLGAGVVVFSFPPDLAIFPSRTDLTEEAMLLLFPVDGGPIALECIGLGSNLMGVLISLR